jgi:hypothetical protein
MIEPQSACSTNIAEVFARLATIRKLSVRSRSRSLDKSGWDGEGAGEVTVEHEELTALVLQETGTWRSKEGRHFQLRNVYRWTLDQPTIAFGFSTFDSVLQIPCFFSTSWR